MFTVISNEGDIFFQFVKGNSNEASVSAFILELSNTLNNLKPSWRSDHILLLDNSSTHKTDTMMRLFCSLSIPTLFSAPASYLVAPIERLFGSLKNCNFEMRETPSILAESMPTARKFTHQQIIFAKVAQFMFSYSHHKILSHYSEAFKNLASFL
jgi:DDE superfamily endonuclease